MWESHTFKNGHYDIWRFDIPEIGETITADESLQVQAYLCSPVTQKKVHLKKFGGTGYSFILEEFIPFLKNMGISNSDIIQITENNPRDLLTII